MNAKENVSLIEDGYKRFIKGDIEGLLGLMAEEVEWSYPPGTPFSGLRRGRGEVREFFAALRRVSRLDNFEVKQYIAAGDRVVALGASRMTALDSGDHADQSWAHLFALRDGKVLRAEFYEDTDAVASIFGQSSAERRAQLGPMGVTEPPFSGYDDGR